MVEEADETLFWLEMLLDADILTKEIIANIEAEAIEIMKVMSSFKKRMEDQN